MTADVNQTSLTLGIPLPKEYNSVAQAKAPTAILTQVGSVTATLSTDDLLQASSPEGVERLFARLDYPTELLGAGYLRDDGLAGLRDAWQLSKVEGELRLYLLETEDLDAATVRTIASRIQSRYPQVSLLLVVTADWRRLAFVNVRPVFSDAGRVTVKTYRVTIDRQNPTRPDLDLLNALWCTSEEADEVYAKHCGAFNVDKVTEKFYKQYGALFRRFLDALQPQEAAIIQSVRRHSHRQESIHAFAVRLMGRVMFLYFLQKKGWLAGDTGFLERRYAECMEQGRLYYNEVLEPLFFTYLATREGKNSPWGRIPYLNGGLFVREYEDDLVLHVPNELFDTDALRGKDERGLLGFFASYNFTVDEDTPLDVQVALDPELLGKVFENLLEERQRGRTGTFYTPRPIVNFMVRESVVRHLEEVTAPRIDRQRLLALLDDERWEEVDLTKEEARDLEAKALATRILDPAVGTGAFLVGSLHHLVQIVRACRHRLGDDLHPGTTAMADLKRRIIRDCLFGVDIEPEGVELAQLRLWLSLVLDLDPTEDPDPLPNLDFELMVGNSLIDSVEGVSLAPNQRATGQTPRLPLDDSDARLRRIIDLKREFYATSDLPIDQREMYRQRVRADEMAVIRAYWDERAAECMRRADALGKTRAEWGGLDKRQADELDRQVRRGEVYQHAANAVASGDLTTRPFVFELEFADIFDERGGFDIVIANPPYVSVQGSSGLPYREELRRRYTERVNGREKGWVDDLYVHFVFRAFELARPGGVVCFITSDTYFTIQSKWRMRELLHGKDLRVVAPCDPFKATVDASVFLGFNRPRLPEPECEFDQMRYVPDEDFDRLSEQPAWHEGATGAVDSTAYQVQEWTEGKLRRYRFDPQLWLGTKRIAIWEPSRRNAALYEQLILPAEPLLSQWWGRIATNELVRENLGAIQTYQQKLSPGDVTLLGLLIDGGQGLCLGDNGRFLAHVLTPSNREQVLRLLKDTARRVGIDVREVTDPVTVSARLLAHAAGAPSGFRTGLRRGEIYQAVAAQETTTDLTETEKRNGAQGTVWVPYSKGNPEGVRWHRSLNLALRYDAGAVAEIRSHPSCRWQNSHLYFVEGVAVNNIGNHVPLKARWDPVSVPDQKSRKFVSVWPKMSTTALLGLLNAPVLSYICKHFLNNTNSYNTGDIRSLPVLVPDEATLTRVERVATRAVEAARLGQETEGFVGEVESELEAQLGLKEHGPFDEF